MINIPQIKMAIVAVSRDCFPRELSVRRRKAVVEQYRALGAEIFECEIAVENEVDAVAAVAAVKASGANALCVFLGNFGPETPETIMAQMFDGPVMFAAAAEGDGDLYQGRGDAYCGMLNCSYNLKLRNISAHIPKYPVGSATEVAQMIAEFEPVARAIIGLKKLKIITFGPRPQDFLACNAPIKQLYNLGVEIEENSELDLLSAFKAHKDDPRIESVVEDMKSELQGTDKFWGILPTLAQYELTLLDWAEAHKGAREYVAFANKCWPAFQPEFGFVPCFVNSRLTGRGIPVSCEVDIYGTLSEYIGICVSDLPVTLLDINNTVPESIYKEHIEGKMPYKFTDTFMGFHCGNTCGSMLKVPQMSYQLIMKRLLEADLPEADITRGTLEGQIKGGDITFYRLQSTACGNIRAYIAEGEVLDVDPCTFGGTGIFAINEMARFYRNILIAKGYPHHGAVAFGHYGKALFDVFAYFGVEDIGFNRPAGVLYDKENPF